MAFRADLHCHTTCSDGTYTPEALLRYAVQEGLSGLSITDHDTVAAYEVAVPLAQSLHLHLGSGVEFSSHFQGMNIHILGYNFRLEDQGIQALCARHMLRREQRNALILDRLRLKKMPIEESELRVKSGVTIGRPHIAILMVEKGYVKSLKEAFDSYIGDGKSCFDPGEPVSAEETIAVIQQAGGKAFMAHPQLIRQHDKVPALLNLPFDGIECYYARCSPDLEAKWLKIARLKKWLVSGGSDFHGSVKQQLSLGCSWVDEETFLRIFTP